MAYMKKEAKDIKGPCIKIERLNDKQVYIGDHDILTYTPAYCITDKHERYINSLLKISLSSILE